MNSSKLKLPGGDAVEVDDKGYLLNWLTWSPGVARVMAAADGVELGDDHWAVMKIFRDYFEQYEIEPPMRALVRQAREVLGEEKGSSRYLYKLFHDGPGTQGCRYAGLPRPVSCI
jgi:tRNA 2-thiouridine synthesizing protein E